MNIVIVGHIDHGKSTLIGRLLYDTNSIAEQKMEEIRETCETLGHGLEFAYITDALEEEREQQLTIDTTQTFFKSDRRDYAIIDVPGHKEFLKNMITGASQADAAVLIVDGKEGVKDQTKRHAYILKFLGIEQIVVAVNKMDLVGFSEDRFVQTSSALLDYLRLVGINPKYVVPISAYKGDNVVNKSDSMPWYVGKTIIQALDSFEEASGEYDFRMPVQDVYEIGGEKVFVGNILSGSLSKGDRVRVFPLGEGVTVKKIVTLEGELETANRPKSIGVVLDGDSVVERGNILCKGKDPMVVKRREASVLCMSSELSVGKEYAFRCATQESECRLSGVSEKIDVSTLEKLKGESHLGKAEVGRVVLEFEKPVVIEKFNALPELGRFVLEESGEIIAGGVIA